MITATRRRSQPLARLGAALVLVGLVLLSGAPSGWARSSGGYSTPGVSAVPMVSRRPSVSSGGYSVLVHPAVPAPAAPSAPASGGDRALSRQQSGSALQGYRDQQAPRPAAPQAPGQPQSPNYGGSAPGYAPQYGGSQYYGTPQYGSGSGSGFIQGALLGVLLQSLSKPGRDRYFYDHQDDPAYLQWRAQQDLAAQSNPQLHQMLTELDGKVAQLAGQPRDPAAAAPADAVAQAQNKGGSTVWIVVFVGVALLVLLFVWRRRLASGPASTATSTGTVPVTPPSSITGSTRTRFRVGMTMPLDPSPFILAAGATKVRAPEGGAMISVAGLGVLEDGGVALNRLYLPGDEGFFQLHLDAAGTPDECRWFSQIDEVTPASPDEWAAWLDPAQGMIGYPQFQTKDGRLYNRAWAPGDTRIEPRSMTETVQTLDGAGKLATASHKVMAMLYAAPTGAVAPAPQTEYILVSALDDGGRAWVEIHAGIDIAPGTLTLPATSL